MKRPNCNRIHFSLDGTIALASRIPIDFIRPGDTASGYDEDDEEIFLWRCEFTPAGIAWHNVEPWTKERFPAYVDGAVLCVVTTDMMRVVETLAEEGRRR